MRVRAKIDFQRATDEELTAFWKKNHRASWRAAKAFFGLDATRQAKGCVTALRALAAFASNLVAYRYCRRKKDKPGMTAYKYSLRACFNTVLGASTRRCYVTAVKWAVV
jgi:hypothetical protein